MGRNQELLDIGYRNRPELARSLIGTGKLGTRTLHTREGPWVELWLIAGLGFRMYEAVEMSRDSQPPDMGGAVHSTMYNLECSQYFPATWASSTQHQN